MALVYQPRARPGAGRGLRLVPSGRPSDADLARAADAGHEHELVDGAGGLERSPELFAADR
jgi:hypothetical protein